MQLDNKLNKIEIENSQCKLKNIIQKLYSLLQQKEKYKQFFSKKIQLQFAEKYIYQFLCTEIPEIIIPSINISTLLNTSTIITSGFEKQIFKLKNKNIVLKQSMCLNAFSKDIDQLNDKLTRFSKTYGVNSCIKNFQNCQVQLYKLLFIILTRCLKEYLLQKTFGKKYQIIFLGISYNNNHLYMYYLSPLVCDDYHIEAKKKKYMLNTDNFIKIFNKFLNTYDFSIVNFMNIKNNFNYSDLIENQLIFEEINFTNNSIYFFTDFNESNIHLNSNYEINYIYDLDIEFNDNSIDDNFINSL